MLTNIQRLRAIAAILVVMFHTNGTAAKYGYDTTWLWALQPWGSTGVDVFFVISGFIMVHIQQRKGAGPLGFLQERLFRIVPMYWLLTSSLLILFICAPKLFNSQDLDIPWASSSYVFMSQAYAGKMPVLYDGWTLEYEMLFYLVFAMALNIRRLEWAVFASASAMLFFYLATGQMIVLEFVYGMVLGLIKQHCHTAPVRPWVTLILGLLCLYFSGVNGLQSDEHRAWAIGIPAALIVYSSMYAKQWPADLLTKLGDASYSIYLVQVFTISGWYKLANKLNLPHWDFSLNVACVLGTVVFGTLTHACVEKPLTRLVLPFKAWLQRVLRAPAYQ